MSKAVKAMIAAELKDRYAGVHSLCVVDMTGMKVAEQQQLRVRLREKSARVEVVKNSLARRAFQDSPLEAVGASLTGPCTLVTTSESLVEAAKTLVEAAKEFTQLKLKQAILDGDPTLLTVEEVSRMKSQTEVLGQVACLIVSPGRAVAGCLGSPQARIAGCLKAMADKAA
jgi:large subunit ribosomal protein L10